MWARARQSPPEPVSKLARAITITHLKHKVVAENSSKFVRARRSTRLKHKIVAENSSEFVGARRSRYESLLNLAEFNDEAR